MKKKSVLCGLLACMIFFAAAVFAEEAPAAEQVSAEAPAAEVPDASSPGQEDLRAPLTAETRETTAGDSFVRWPELTGGEDPEPLEEINTLIRERLGVPEYLDRMNALQGSRDLKVSWRGGFTGKLFSAAAAAEGAVRSLRADYVWTGVTVDPESGKEILWEDLFSDPESARLTAEEYLEWSVGPELSGYLLSSQLTPMPETFYLTARGIVLLYPLDMLRTLSDRAGDVLIPWNIVEEELLTEEGSAAEKAGALEMLELTEDSREKLRAAAESGRIPDLPVTLGGSLKEETDRWHLLIDPDVYEGGRMFSLEGGLFRNVFLLTDRLGEEWDESLIRGIRFDEGCLYGLRIGATSREEWLEALGEPDSTVEFDADRAEAYRTLPGRRDYYQEENGLLQLHSDEDGVLVSIILEQ